MAAEDSVVRLKIDGNVFEVDMSDLTLNEVGTIEDLTGKSVQEIDWESARAMQGVAWIAMHRANPRLTLEEVGNIRFSQIGEAEEERPTGGARARGKSGATTS
jgi:hypothetical protein